MKSGRLAIGTCAMLAIAGGCRPSAAPTSQPVTPVAERGPFKLFAKAEPTELWIGDAVTLELRVETPEDAAVAFPGGGDFGKSLEVRRIDREEPKLDPAGGYVWRQRYQLEPLASGPVEIPAVTVHYGHAAASQPAQSQPGKSPAGQPAKSPGLENELATIPISLAVKSALTSKDSVASPREITGVLTPPHEPLKPWQIAALAAGGLAATGLIYWGFRRLRARLLKPRPPIAPEIWALQELVKLGEQRLVESGRAREFYYRLTEVVRRYIELKFALAAPEMTTDEFLNALAREPRSLPLDSPRLREFLVAGDLVKYAAMTPGAEESEASLSTARSFIHSSAAAAEQAAREAAARAAQPGAAA